MPDTIPQGGRDYFRSLERRLMRLERRGTPNTVQSILGPGIASQAVRIMDWNSRDTTLNGYYYSGVGSINSPDSELSWTGQVIAKDDGTGMQQVWNTDGPTTQYWMRTYAPTPEPDDENVLFSEWKKFATPSGLIGVNEIDPDFIDSLPPPDLTDGTPVTTGPVVTPIGGIGSMFFRWTEVANADPVTYRLHVRADETPATDGTDQVASGVGLTFASVRRLADGTAIVGDGSVVYHAIVTAEDDDNAGPPVVAPGASAEVTGVPAQVTGQDIAVGAVTTDTLVFNTGWGAELNGETITGATVQTRAAAKQGVKLGTIDGTEGVFVYDGSGAVFFKAIPSEGLATLNAILKALTLTVTDGTSLGGITEITRAPDGTAGAIRLTGYTTAPKSEPIVTTGYDTVQFTDADWNKWGDRRGWTTDGTYWYTARDSLNGQTYLERWDPATGQLQATSGSNTGVPYGVVHHAGKLYTLANYRGQFRVYRHSATTLIYETMGYWNDNDGLQPWPTIGIDPVNGNILLAQSRATNSDKIRVQRYTMPATALTPLVSAGAAVNMTSGWSVDLRAVLLGAFDFGIGNVFVLPNAGAADIRVTTADTGTFQPSRYWPSGMSSKVGVAWNGTAFVSMDTEGVMRTYTGIGIESSTGDSDLTKWVSNTLANATLETGQSPRAKVVMPKRSKLFITTSAINSGGANAPDRVKVYVGQGLTDPGRAAMWKQTDPAVGFTTIGYASLVTSGTNPPVTNGFALAAGTVQRIEFADGTAFIDGIGNGSVGTGTFRDSVRAALSGDYAAGAWNTYTPTFTAATTNPTLGNFTRAGRWRQIGKTVNFSIVITANSSTGLGVGNYDFGLPVPARSLDEVVVNAIQTAPARNYIGRCPTSTNEVRLFLTSDFSAASNTTSGMINGTTLRISGTYEAA